MKDLVTRIRNTEALLGDGLKKAEDCETRQADLVRRSIVVNRDMVEGECLKLEDLSWVRPAGGIAPGNEDLIVGKFLKKELSSGDLINELDLETRP
jgi:sialic acid synthase SpsE